MNPKHFEMRKIDYVISSLALGRACKMISYSTGKPLNEVREELINVASQQAYSLTAGEQSEIVDSYIDCLANPSDETQIKEFIFFDNSSNN